MVVHNFRDRGAVAHLRRRGPLLLLLRVLRHRQKQEEKEGPGRDSSFHKFPVANIVFKNQSATKLLILFNILEREIKLHFVYICVFSVKNMKVVKHQNYGNSDTLQSLTGYFANGVVLMVDWTIPQCDKLTKKSLMYPKL